MAVSKYCIKRARLGDPDGLAVSVRMALRLAGGLAGGFSIPAGRRAGPQGRALPGWSGREGWKGPALRVFGGAAPRSSGGPARVSQRPLRHVQMPFDKFQIFPCTMPFGTLFSTCF